MNTSFNPPDWARPSGYSNVISASGKLISIAGQIGWNNRQEFETDDFANQVRQALINIKSCLDAAGAKPEHVVRLTWYITSRQEYMNALKETGEAYRETFGRVYPTMSMIEVSSLMELAAKVEIEATAVVPE